MVDILNALYIAVVIDPRIFNTMLYTWFSLKRIQFRK